MTSITVPRASGRPTIAIDGDFTVDINREFRDAYKTVDERRPVVVDLSRSACIDSAGLGMLLRSREYAGGTKHSVTVTGANDTVRSIFGVAHFEQLFTIS